MVTLNTTEASPLPLSLQQVSKFNVQKVLLFLFSPILLPLLFLYSPILLPFPFLSGHESPGYQPFASSFLIKSFVQNKLDQLTVKGEVKAIESESDAPKKLTQGSILRSKITKTLKALKEVKA